MSPIYIPVSSKEPLSCKGPDVAVGIRERPTQINEYLWGQGAASARKKGNGADAVPKQQRHPRAPLSGPATEWPPPVSAMLGRCAHAAAPDGARARAGGKVSAVQESSGPAAVWCEACRERETNRVVGS
jgi:hypothetical protein